jgi:hypothetical protein
MALRKVVLKDLTPAARELLTTAFKVVIKPELPVERIVTSEPPVSRNDLVMGLAGQLAKRGVDKPQQLEILKAIITPGPADLLKGIEFEKPKSLED